MSVTILYCSLVALVFLILWKFTVLKTFILNLWEALTISSYYVCHAVVRTLQRVVWSCNGVKDHMVMAEYGAVYESCVQVQRIIHRGRFSTMNHPRPWDFIGLHENFTHPQVLLSPYVSLYCVTETHAYFLQHPDDVDVHHSRTSPFMYMAQFEHAITLYCIPLGHFHKLADEVGNPQIPVIWISNTGRCGSTLLVQMLENVPGTRCMSEPDALTNISLMDRAEQMSKEGINKALCSTIRMLCKPAPGIQRIAIKSRFNCVTEVDQVIQLFPEFHHLYMYRNMGNIMKSYYKFLHRDLVMCMLEWLVNNNLVSRLIPYVRNYLVHFIAGEESKKRAVRHLADVNFMGYVTTFVGSCVVEFQRLLETKAISMPTLHYNDLMRRPVEVTTEMFELLSLPSHYVQMALTAMQHDTQKGTILSNISNSSNNLRKMTGQDVRDMNVMLSVLGLPDMNEELRLPNGICG
ncbi:uncharacterized protein LOC106013418 [Aplysia californica]|uniref:Uncharacterized protein LOC106013418 n=1 Tax=Aplysia californica TaxID=6500 RepID=A0ABM1ABK7_APLCA|nr:uncharacterized protein LOC106013418 [Aplysia californica]